MQDAPPLRFVCNNMLPTMTATTSTEEGDAWVTTPLINSHFMATKSNIPYVDRNSSSSGSALPGSSQNPIHICLDPQLLT